MTSDRRHGVDTVFGGQHASGGVYHPALLPLHQAFFLPVGWCLVFGNCSRSNGMRSCDVADGRETEREREREMPVWIAQAWC